MQVRHDHRIDVVMQHALRTGQWAQPVTFRDLTGRDVPRLIDSRPRPPEDPEVREKRERAEAFLAEHEAKMREQGRER